MLDFRVETVFLPPWSAIQSVLVLQTPESVPFIVYTFFLG